ncbi:acyl-CoA synthetase [Bacillus sp. REN16]|uniref:acyl-CoA synthetase n=1 Tax=Bacillus sp. REN16 TaxID=2887296 RepID=UPI001E594803|nr:long-chain fatty acid--CoA ligase [Bacillus sp. REN16]MCC3355510.1 long-chain fatty acid--CoA ligase [Bacillus sp. REN16]
MRWELDWIANRARLSPDSIAVVDGETGSRFTFKELNKRAENIASYFKTIGINKGDRIALLSPNDICYFDLLFACGKIGAIFVPLNWRLSSEEIDYILSNSSPRLIALSSKLEHILQDKTSMGIIKIDSDEYHRIASVLNKSCDPDECVHEDDPLAIIYTGGTTGKPKGVVLSHQSIMWNGLNTIVSWNLSAQDVTLTYMPMFHTGGLNALSIPILMMGGKVVIAKNFEPNRAIKIINQEGCTVVLLVPTMYHMMIKTLSFKDVKFPTMHTFLSGGAPCPLEIYQAFEEKGLSFKEGYGLTEAGPNNFFIDPKISRFRRGSVGKAMFYNDVKIITSDGRDAKAGEVGELLIRGKHVFHHYWNNPSATKEAYHDGWLHTGDLAKCDEEGYHYIVGRKKEMIITGGENVYPLEVEQCISKHPVINEVAVIGVPHEKWGEMVIAVVSLMPDQQISRGELKEYCQTKIGKYKVPKDFIFVDEIPKTHVGKIDKNQLQKTYENLVG